jgi:hypothetical protein
MFGMGHGRSGYADGGSFHLCALESECISLIRVGPQGVIASWWIVGAFYSLLVGRDECCMVVTGLRGGSWVIKWGSNPYALCNRCFLLFHSYFTMPCPLSVLCRCFFASGRSVCDYRGLGVFN